MRISDWSSDVFSSDLPHTGHRRDRDAVRGRGRGLLRGGGEGRGRSAALDRAGGRDARVVDARGRSRSAAPCRPAAATRDNADRQSGGGGKRVEVRLDIGGLRILKKKKIQYNKN